MAFQGIFRKNNKFVVVKTIHLTAKDVLEVGTVIDVEKHHVRLFQLRLWFRRLRIGTVGTPWAEEMLKGKRPNFEQIEVAKQNADNPELIGLETQDGLDKLKATIKAIKDKKIADETPTPATAEEEQEAIDMDAAHDLRVTIAADAKAEQDIIDAKFNADREQAEADEAAEKAKTEQSEADTANDDLAKLQAKKDRRNKREREKRAAKKAGK